MTNRFREVTITQHLLDPTEPEVWINVKAERQTPATEVKGRLLGPRCPYSSTVEVAFPVQKFARVPEGLGDLARRVVLPEACLWEPISPFMYQGTLELWQDGTCCDRRPLSLGLRTVQLGAQALRLNGKGFSVRGVERDCLAEEDAGRLRREGVNTLVVTVAAETSSLWDVADRLGFFVLGRIDTLEKTLQLAKSLQNHPSCLGWLLDQEHLENANDVASGLDLTGTGGLLGIALAPPPKYGLPACVDFLYGEGGFATIGRAPRS